MRGSNTAEYAAATERGEWASSGRAVGQTGTVRVAAIPPSTSPVTEASCTE